VLFGEAALALNAGTLLLFAIEEQLHWGLCAPGHKTGCTALVSNSSGS
jgi:hypothetical protein